MIDNASKAFFHLLARSSLLQRYASRYGMRKPTSFARRFIAGETVEEAIHAAKAVEGLGLTHTLDQLGESIGSLADADLATRAYLAAIDAIVTADIGRNLSLKLTQIGLAVDRASTVDNLRRILDRAVSFFVRIDMESSTYTDVTLTIFEILWNQGYRHMGVVLQADLRRSEADFERINQLGARIRLVKGAYREPKAVAYQNKAEVDLSFARLMKRLLVEGTYPAIATHDPAMLELARRYADDLGVSRDRFEFQMLYGIRRDLQAALHAQGYKVRVYIPFGRQWFPYFMRRLGERPANVAFVLRGVLGEGRYEGTGVLLT